MKSEDMEEIYQSGNTNKEESSFYITLEAREFLREISKWTKFLSIIGFIGIGFMILGGFLVGTILLMADYSNAGGAGLPWWVFSIIYPIMAVIYVFPVYYLFQFSNNMKKALQINNANYLSISFRYLKSHYKFIGIFTITLLTLYAFLFVILIFIGVFAALLS